MPRVLEAQVLARVRRHSFRNNLWIYCNIQEVILDGLRYKLGDELSLGFLQGKYTYKHLQKLLRDLVCPVTRMSRNFVLGRQPSYLCGVPGPEEAAFYGDLANFVAS